MKRITPDSCTPRNSIPHKLKSSGYEGMLDSVYEMSRDVAEGNGISYEDAMCIVLEDEGWNINKKDFTTILNMLKEAV